MNNIDTIYIITNSKYTQKITDVIKANNISRITTTICFGDLRSKLMKLLELDKVSKEMIVFNADKTKTDYILKKIETEVNLDSKNTGIAFVISNEEGNMYSLINVIVEKGKAEEVVDISNSHGGKGATIINGRGSTKTETQKLFSINVEPEKEIVMILVEKSFVEKITTEIEQKLELNTKGKGVIIVQPVEKALGIVK